MRTAVILTFVGLLAGCATTPAGSGSSKDADLNSPDNYLGFQPIDPLPIAKVALYNRSADAMREVFWPSLCENGDVRQALPLQSAQVSVSKVNVSGKVSYLTAALSGSAGVYEVTMDYMKYRVEDDFNDTGGLLGSRRVGVGLRIRAIVKTTEAGLNLSGLGALSAEAKRGALRGSISVDVIGIDSADVINLIPLTSELDQTSIQSALQALASIKAKMCDNTTMLTPHIVAIKQTKPKTGELIRRHAMAGIAAGQQRIKQKDSILAAVSHLDKPQWDKLVEACALTDKQKDELKKLTDLAAINGRLDLDAGMNGTVLSALNEKLTTLGASDKGGQQQ